jgi:hypothetical protein
MRMDSEDRRQGSLLKFRMPISGSEDDGSGVGGIHEDRDVE